MAISSKAAAAGATAVGGLRGFFRPSMPTLRRVVGNIGWPILIKELRADFRRNRFFVTHFLCILAMAIGVMIAIALLSSEKLTSVQMGRQLFNTFFVLQFAIVLVVFPALTATAFTEERSNKSLDLLLTTDLKASEIVFGKFLATSSYCLITLFATVPLLALSTLFGGVRMGDVAIAYAILLGHTVVISMLGVYCSSLTRSNLRSTLSVYAVVFLLFGVSYRLWWGQVWESGAEAKDSTLVGQLLRLSYPEEFELSLVGGPWPGWALLIGLVLIVGLVFSYLYVLTTNRIRTPHEDRSSGLRCLTLVVLPLYLAGALVQPPISLPTTSETIEAVDAFLQGHVIVAGIALFAATLTFSTETLHVSRRIRGRYAAFRNLGIFARVLMPGSFTAVIYVTILGAVSAAALLVAIERAKGWIDPAALPLRELGIWIETIDSWCDAVVFLPIYCFAFAALGFFLASVDFSRGYGLLTVLFTFIITLLLPVILEVRGVPDGLLGLYYLSPITIGSSLEARIDRYANDDGPSYLVLGDVPVIDFATYLFLAAGAAFLAAGCVLASRKGYPLLSLDRPSINAARSGG